MYVILYVMRIYIYIYSYIWYIYIIIYIYDTFILLYKVYITYIHQGCLLHYTYHYIAMCLSMRVNQLLPASPGCLTDSSMVCGLEDFCCVFCRAFCISANIFWCCSCPIGKTIGGVIIVISSHDLSQQINGEWLWNCETSGFNPLEVGGTANFRQIQPAIDWHFEQQFQTLKQDTADPSVPITEIYRTTISD